MIEDEIVQGEGAKRPHAAHREAEEFVVGERVDDSPGADRKLLSLPHR